MRVTLPDPKHDQIYALQETADALSRSESTEDCRRAIEIYTKILSMLTPGRNLWIERTMFISARARAYRKVGSYEAALADLRECIKIESGSGNSYTVGVLQKQIDEITTETKTVASDEQCISSRACSPSQADVRFIEDLLKDRLALLESECANHRGIQTMKPRWAKLMVPDVLAFSVCEICTHRLDGTHHYKGRRFAGVSVCVSTIPTMNPARARAFFRDGYLGFLTVIMNELGFAEGELDLAHWIYMADGSEWNLDLTFMPSRNMVRTQGPNSITIVAPNLLSDAERRTVLGR